MRKKLVLTPDLVARVDRTIPQDHLPPDPNRVPMTDEDFAVAVAQILASAWPGPVWVFGYGSLLWNPGFAFEERRPARLRGWHRAFCMQLFRFRGSPEQPGLMLALDHGGSCKGEVFRIAGRRRRAGTRKARAPRNSLPPPGHGPGASWMSTFRASAGRRSPFMPACGATSSMRRLPIHTQAHMLARAAGHGGSGAAYLHQTVTKLEELGIHDSYLWELQHLVAAEIRAMFSEA